MQQDKKQPTQIPGPGGRGPGQITIGSKPKDFKKSIKRLIKELRPFLWGNVGGDVLCCFLDRYLIYLDRETDW